MKKSKGKWVFRGYVRFRDYSIFYNNLNKFERIEYDFDGLPADRKQRLEVERETSCYETVRYHVFVNDATGEVKHFESGVVEVFGVDKTLKRLNEEE